MIPADPKTLDGEAYAQHRARGFDLAELQHQAEHALDELNTQARQAQEAGASEATELTSGRLTQGLAYESQATAALPILEDGERAHAAAIGRVYSADAAWRAGTPDAEVAARTWSELVAAHAAERHQRGIMPGLRAAVSGPLQKLARMANDADARAWQAVFTETRAISSTLLSPYGGSGEAMASARRLGERSKAAHAALWPVAEAVVAKQFAEEIKGADAAHRAGRYWRAGHHGPPPSIDDLRAAFAARRAGLEAARSSARNALAEISS